LPECGLFSLSYPDSLHAWAVGSSGIPLSILRTEDGGFTWNPVLTGPPYPIRVSALNGSTAWASTSSGEVMKTTDGGTHWESLSTGTDLGLPLLQFVDERHGWVVPYGTDDHPCRNTTDGGATWSEQTWGLPADVWAFFFVDSLYGWAAGGDDWATGLRHTTDGGETWTDQDQSAFGNIITFADRRHGWTGGVYSRIARTTDGGDTWQLISVPGTEYLTGLCFTDSLHGFGLCSSGVIFSTADGGLTWSSVDMHSTWFLNDMDFADATHGLAVGYGSSVLKWCNPAPTIASARSAPVTSFALSAYPNPSTPLRCCRSRCRPAVRCSLPSMTSPAAACEFSPTPSIHKEIIVLPSTPPVWPAEFTSPGFARQARHGRRNLCC
jgi:photosystem II stability/assembly factor-like uncharacterized protein